MAALITERLPDAPNRRFIILTGGLFPQGSTVRIEHWDDRACRLYAYDYFPNRTLAEDAIKQERSV